MVEWIGLIYAAIVAAGGFIGYLKAGSITSLAAGLVGGSIAGIGAMKALNNFIVISDDENQLLTHLKKTCGPSKSVSNLQKLEFTLDTKYYSSSVLLTNFDSLRSLAIWRVSNKEIPVQSFCHFMKRSQSVLDLTKIDSLSEYFNFDTKIIACHLSSIPQPFATTLSRWATDRGYEIVDLEPSDEDVAYFKEVNERYGLDRIIEILEGTSWDKKDTKSQAGLAAAAARMRLKEDGDSDEFEEFDGNLDAKDKRVFKCFRMDTVI
uniref:Uncharacterized protein n=1 Tax=Panagrolaimus davidi TaxID=227884 RepID=A0A914PRW8_9BILA